MSSETQNHDLESTITRNVYRGLNSKLSPESSTQSKVSKLLPKWFKDYVRLMSGNGQENKK